MGKTKKDITWEHCTQVNPQNKHYLKCNYCNQCYWGGIFRMKNHLAHSRSDTKPCSQCPSEVVSFFKNVLNDMKGQKQKRQELNVEIENIGQSSTGSVEKGKEKLLEKDEKQSTINALWKKVDRDSVCQDIARCFYAHSLPFTLIKSPFFKKMITSAISFGHGLKFPSYHELRNTLLKKEVDRFGEMFEEHKKEWKRIGCTIMSDGWTDRANRSITNFLINSPNGTLFYKSVDTSDISKTAENLFKLIDEVIENIGEENVVQIITDSASAYVRAGQLLMEKRKKLFWSPCAAHCIDLMLSDIGKLPLHADTISKARSITVFIYQHCFLLNLMRKHTKGKELTRPAITRFATSFLTLRSISEQMVGLRSMFTSSEWEKSPLSRSSQGSKVRDIILIDSTFWASIKYCIKSVSPLVKVLRLVDSDEKPAMGYIYEAMDRAKEEIAKNLGNIKKRYMPIWKIIDERWNYQLHRPLHAAAYYLNPAFQYDDLSRRVDIEVKQGWYDCLERMCPSTKERIKIEEQLTMFQKRMGLFGRDTALATRKTKQPADWWFSFGDGCPELQNLAIRILSLTCSATGCERNWSTFEQVHSKKRNRLGAERLANLVFVKYNLQLKVRQVKRREEQRVDPICLSDIESDDECITEKEEPALPSNMTWMDMDEVFQEKLFEQGESSSQPKLPRPRRTHFVSGRKRLHDEEEEEEEEEDEQEREDSQEVDIDDDDDAAIAHILLNDDEEDDNDSF